MKDEEEKEKIMRKNYEKKIAIIIYYHQRIDKVSGGLGNNRTSGNHPNYSIIKIGQNTEESPEDLRILSVI